MHWVDWLIVVTLNGAVIAVGLLMARAKQTSSEWFLGNRALPWWAIGMSMFATNVDNADIVAVAGSTYNEGLHIISVYAIGSALGGASLSAVMSWPAAGNPAAIASNAWCSAQVPLTYSAEPRVNPSDWRITRSVSRRSTWASQRGCGCPLPSAKSHWI